ncbi:hypothetical protein M1771_04300 [Spiroplasma citri]|uniref:Phage protein n=1 Tax=Spiroplasma citri TaxID=2133 RepID=A0AAX3T0Y0_SPICI|nr:hypothetical protein [Spiroplasma citri]WFG97229.1 hypothetical protein M0C40_04315 [Spiroplasma citri]WFH01127.1 hypothetical protein M1771_04300 [Spiroplasma citri]
MGKRKYCEDCQEDGLNIPYDGYYWSFSDKRYTQKEIDFIVGECSARELRQNFKAKLHYVCASCLIGILRW